MSKDFEISASQCQLVVIEKRLTKLSIPNKISQLCLRIMVRLRLNAKRLMLNAVLRVRH